MVTSSKYTLKLFYSGNPDKDIVEIEDIKIIPENIAPGKEFTIETSGNLNEQVSEGSFVKVTVKVGSTTVFRKTLDLCETITKKEGNEIRRPIPAGPIKVIKKVQLLKVTTRDCCWLFPLCWIQ